MDVDAEEDLILAMQLQELDAVSSPSNKRKEPEVTEPAQNSLTDVSLEMMDPTPDIHQLFMNFNRRFFWGKLDSVEIKWSPRMKRCAGLCAFQTGGYCVIRLSVPLLKLRPRRDLVETLLHEMIHAYLFVIGDFRDRNDHGPNFHMHMYRINNEAGTNITVYHNFHDEVDHYHTHWWQCDGPCRHRPPYFGLVKRSMNRPPGPYDFWWPHHEAMCGGTYTKIRDDKGHLSERGENKENSKGGNHTIPEYFGSSDSSSSVKPDDSRSAKKPKTDKKSPTGAVQRRITDYVTSPTKNSEQLNGPGCAPSKPQNTFLPFSGHGQVLGGASSENEIRSTQNFQSSTIATTKDNGQVMDVICIDSDDEDENETAKCPICNAEMELYAIVEHVELCQSLRDVVGNETMEVDASNVSEVNMMVSCPSCQESVRGDMINQHLDECLTT